MIVCKSAAELEKMRAAGQIGARVLAQVAAHAAPGVSLLELEALAEKEIAAGKGEPAFKGYRGYPCVLCTSVNEEIVHGIPSERKLREGDILSIDVGIKLEGFYVDTATTVLLEPVALEVKTLVRVTREALDIAVEQARAGNYLNDIGKAVQKHVEGAGFNVVREFVGHGIGTQLHEEPQVPNYATPGRGPKLRPGMVLALEPMVTKGSPAVKMRPDRWTAVVADGGHAAHFEHCVAVTQNGPWVLTEA
ncbi:MAG: type I methionyl aminopeptidase [Acidobacteria bacterium]|nr:type I methionyl aminopeptidase [Acidobacteriota bacterium]MCH7985750.1 type I methionyl aminopeptidase [Acidobacteriota bacterium]